MKRYVRINLTFGKLANSFDQGISDTNKQRYFLIFMMRS